MGSCISSKTATYPGNRRVAKPAYQPGAGDYEKVNATIAVATAHFVACPGGNALKLVGKPNRAELPTAGAEGLPRHISVTLPPGVNAGDVIHVRAPDGRMNAISVPPGMGPGSTFTVEFSDDAPPPLKDELAPGVYAPMVTAVPEVEAAVGMAVAATAATEPYAPAVYAAK